MTAPDPRPDDEPKPPINLGYVGNRPENTAEFIANAPADVAYLLAALADRDAKLARVEVVEQRLERSMQGEDREIAEAIRAAVADTTRRRGSHLYKVLWDGEFICGCGDPDAAYEIVWRVVKHFDDERKHTDQQLATIGGDRIDAILGLGSNWVPFTPTLDEMFPDPGARQIIVGAVDGLGLIDHGTSFYSSWLTDKGKWFLWAVESIGGIEGIDNKLDMVGFPQHGDSWKESTPCTDECWKVPA